MPLFFWFNNFHFALEFLGALVFFGLGWLAFDALRARRDVKTVAKGVGFLFLATWGVIHSLDLVENLPLFLGILLNLGGLGLVLLNLFLEKPPPRPKFMPAIVVLPAVLLYLRWVNIAALLLAGGVGALAWWRFKAERNRNMVAIAFGFSFLALANIFAAISPEQVNVSLIWVLEHALRLSAFMLLAVWLWQFLQTRVIDQLFLIFVLLAGIIGILVTFSFSASLLAQIQKLVLVDVRSAGRSLEFMLDNASQIAKTEVKLFAEDPALIRSLSRKSLREVENLSRAKASAANLDFMTIAEPNGVILVRTHALTIRGETATQDPVFRRANQSGNDAFDILVVEPEGLSLRAASPVFSGNLPVGVVIGGYLLDEVFAKRMTGILGHDVKFLAAAREGIPDVDKVFSGNVSLEGKPYTAYITSLKNNQGLVVGRAAVLGAQTALSKVATATNRLTLATSIFVLLVVLLPAEYLFKKLLASR